MQNQNTTNGRQILSATRLRDARSCQRFHRIRYLDGFVPVEEADTLRFGRLIHLGLEAWWAAPAATRLDAALNAIALEADPFDHALAFALICGYDTRYQPLNLEVLAVEVPFRFRMENPDTGYSSKKWDLAGRIDAIAKTPDGRVLIVEHKTISEDLSAGSTYWRRLQMDGQVSIYFQGAKSLGHDVAGCLYDVIAKPGLRPGKATPDELRKYTKDGRLYANQRETDERPEEFRDRLMCAIAEDPTRYYGQAEVVRLEAELDDALADVWNIAHQLNEASRSGRHPRNPDACMRFGRACDYFDVCSGTASLLDDTRFRKLDNVHPELPTT